MIVVVGAVGRKSGGRPLPELLDELVRRSGRSRRDEVAAALALAARARGVPVPEELRKGKVRPGAVG
jgi:hypothetical protein